MAPNDLLMAPNIYRRLVKQSSNNNVGGGGGLTVPLGDAVLHPVQLREPCHRCVCMCLRERVVGCVGGGTLLPGDAVLHPVQLREPHHRAHRQPLRQVPLQAPGGGEQCLLNPGRIRVEQGLKGLGCSA